MPLFSFHLEHPGCCAAQVAVFQFAGVYEKLAVLVFPWQILHCTQQSHFHTWSGFVNVQNELVFRIIQRDGIKGVFALRVTNRRLFGGVGGLQAHCRQHRALLEVGHHLFFHRFRRPQQVDGGFEVAFFIEHFDSMLALGEFHFPGFALLRVDDFFVVDDESGLVIGLDFKGIGVGWTMEHTLPMGLEVVAADGGVGRVAFPVEVDLLVAARHFDGLHLVEFFVRLCAVNGFPVDVEPTTEVEQAFLLQKRDFAVGGGAHVECHAAACCHEDAEMADEFVGSHIVFQRLVAVEAKRAPQAATFSPWAVGEGDACTVFRCAEAVLLSFAPTVVDNGILSYGVVVPRNEFGGMPLFGSVAPFAVGEEDGRLVACDEFLELRNHVRIYISANVFIGVDIPAVDVAFPFGQRVVEAHFEAFFAHGFGQFAANVAFRSKLDGIPAWRILAWPKAETVMVFRDQKHVFRPRFLEEVGPFVRIPKLGFPHRRKVLILKVFAIDAFLESLAVVVGHQAAIVPFGVAFETGVGRNGIHAPMDENAQFGVAEPLRIAPLVDGFPGGLHLGGKDVAQQHGCKKK